MSTEVRTGKSQQIRVLRSPGGFWIGPDILPDIYAMLKDYGEKTLLIADPFLKHLKDDVVSLQKNYGFNGTVRIFEGECTQKEVDRLVAEVQASGAHVVMGIGGGKTLDVSKAVAHFAGIPVVICPTLASSDAPCTALSVIYHEDSSFDRYLFLPQNPDIVCVDTQMIAGAPFRFFASGVADALATYYEARAVFRGRGKNLLGRLPTHTALSIAKSCHDYLVDFLPQAVISARAGVATAAFDKVVEATIYLSGVGAESGGLAAAHAIHNGLTSLAPLHHATHGEKVFFGTITQLFLENADQEDFEICYDIARQVDLPLTLEEMGVDLKDPKMQKALDEAAKNACAPGETMENMPMSVTPDMVRRAMDAANKAGVQMRKEWAAS